MTTILIIALIGLMIATVVALVRGIIAFLQEGTQQVKDGNGPTAAALKSNRMMQSRILFQAGAIIVVVMLLAAAHRT